MKIHAIYDDLTNIASRFGYIIRKEKGYFRGGNCVLNTQKIIVVNTLAPYENRVAIIARVLAELHLEELSIKPIVRLLIEREREHAAKSEQIPQVFTIEMLKPEPVLLRKKRPIQA
ncbi:MAG: hypothetical protein IPM69_03380 [Ignavibacteria bacterium]|nr:hypothetical protein [Ignavibacteria bacterium]